VTLHLNGDEVHVMHVPPAHTDGDSIVHFKKANVIHSGDVVTFSFPIVDFDSGGTYDGLVTAADKVLALCDDATKVIPGHGALMTKADVVAYRQMLLEARDRIGKLLAAKKSPDEIKAAKPLADLEAKWGEGMVKADFFTEILLKAGPAAAPPKGDGKGKHHAK
jgi:cyclase